MSAMCVVGDRPEPERVRRLALVDGSAPSTVAPDLGPSDLPSRSLRSIGRSIVAGVELVHLTGVVLGIVIIGGCRRASDVVRERSRAAWRRVEA